MKKYISSFGHWIIDKTPSGFSETAVVERPDNIPPSAPVFKTIRATTKAVLLAWAFSSSGDIQKHELLRSNAVKADWIVLETIDFLNSETLGAYQDSLAEKGISYDYKLVAIDDSGLRATSKVIRSGIIDNGIREGITELSYEVDRRLKTIDLRWN